ncbi:MAG: translation initiation factor IF-2 associated domain-containing protein, partial [Pseudomonadota bacterium]|nr:translation initiation factor IF-2 associated domain-containing protein [Pseudomonadota bacterium]
MAEVTVSELAKSVGASVERLLKQMAEAGLKHQGEDELVSDEEKKTLLGYLKTQHGESTEAPKKITLKRKTTTTLKAGSGASRKTVNVEVRKKRTFVKRDQDEAAAPVVEEKIAEPVVPEVQAEPAVEPEAKPEAPSISSILDDAEEKRLAALEARRKQEEEERVQQEQKQVESEAGQEVEDEVQKRAAAEAEAIKAQQEEEKGKHGKKKEKHLEDEETDEAEERKKTTKAAKKPGNKKTS